MIKRHEIPVVITDLHLTDGDGIELFSSLQAEQPGITGIIISGSGGTELESRIAERGLRAFLQKPLDADVGIGKTNAIFT